MKPVALPCSTSNSGQEQQHSSQASLSTPHFQAHQCCNSFSCPLNPCSHLIYTFKASLLHWNGSFEHCMQISMIFSSHRLVWSSGAAQILLLISRFGKNPWGKLSIVISEGNRVRVRSGCGQCSEKQRARQGESLASQHCWGLLTPEHPRRLTFCDAHLYKHNHQHKYYHNLLATVTMEILWRTQNPPETHNLPAKGGFFWARAI